MLFFQQFLGKEDIKKEKKVNLNFVLFDITDIYVECFQQIICFNSDYILKDHVIIYVIVKKIVYATSKICKVNLMHIKFDERPLHPLFSSTFLEPEQSERTLTGPKTI